MKIQQVLEEQKALEMLNVFMEELENGSTTQWVCLAVWLRVLFK